MIELADTNAAAIATEFRRARVRAGSPAMGMVLTLVVVVPDDEADEAMAAARSASQEHPARVLGAVLGDGRGRATVNAQVGIGSGWSGETALIRLSGPVVKHPDSVVLPLLLPDSPVVVWWPSHPPTDPAADPLGALAARRITDSSTAGRSRTISHQCAAYAPGNTDLAWTRLTAWRALLAAALDQAPGTVRSASVVAERGNASADLLAAWLGARLKAEVNRGTGSGPGLTEVVLDTAAGPIRLARPDGRLAMLSTPGSPDRPVALKRRELPDLLAEELRHLDEDDVYAATARALARSRSTPKRSAKAPVKKAPVKKAPVKKAPAKKAPAKKTAEKTTGKRARR